MATITATTPELQASAHNWISAEKAAERNAHCSCRTSPTAIMQVMTRAMQGGDAAQHNLLPFLPYDLLWNFAVLFCLSMRACFINLPHVVHTSCNTSVLYNS